jgi:hypothetical protein
LKMKSWLMALFGIVILSIVGGTPASGINAGRDLADVRIGNRTGITKSSHDFAAQNGNLFAVLKSGNYWSVNISTDGGLSWHETYVWDASSKDVSAAVVGDYLYIAYVDSDFPNEARLRRFSVSNGLSDSAFGYTTVFDKGTAINEIALASNADDDDNRLSYSAILSGGYLICYSGRDVNTATLTWTEFGTGVTNAGRGLAAAYVKESVRGYVKYASYIASDGTNPVMVWSRGSAAPSIIQVQPQYTGSHDITSISVYNGMIICVFENMYPIGQGIRCKISYDYGDTWDHTDFLPSSGNACKCPDVTARGGKGTAIIFSEDVGEPDLVWFHHMAGYQPGPWNEAVKINQYDVITGTPNRIQRLPGPNSFGAIYLSGAGIAYFSRINLGGSLPWLMLLMD